jgi:hypothetical protein
VLKVLSSAREAVITDRVAAELRAGVHLVPELQSVLDAKWLKRRVLQFGTELHWYQLFAQRLVAAMGDAINEGQLGRRLRRT